MLLLHRVERTPTATTSMSWEPMPVATQTAYPCEHFKLPTQKKFGASRSCTVTDSMMSFYHTQYTQSQAKGLLGEGHVRNENAFALCPAWRWPQWLHMIKGRGCESDLRQAQEKTVSNVKSQVQGEPLTHIHLPHQTLFCTRRQPIGTW